MANQVDLSTGYYPNPTIGRPLSNANIYVGIVDLDPEDYPKQISVLQESGTTVEVSQPVITSAGGVPLYNGSPVTILVDGSYSLKVTDRHDSQVYYVPKNAEIESTLAFDSIADMRAITTTPENNAVYTLSGYYAPGDGGGGDFYWDSTSTETDNGGTIIKVTAITTGRWKRQYENHVVWLEWFGINNTDALQNCYDVLENTGGFIFSGSEYTITSDIIIPNTPTTLSDQNTMPVIKLIGFGFGVTFKAGADNLNMFNLPGGLGEYNANIWFENLVIDGEGFTGITGIYASGTYSQSSLKNVGIRNCDTIGLFLDYNGENTDSTSIVIEQCFIYFNGVNIRMKNTQATNYNLYGATFKDSTIALATGTDDAGIGIDLDYVKDIVFINTVIQSNGKSGSSYGYGIGLKINKCKQIRGNEKTHLENHDANLGTSYDLIIAGNGTTYSELIYLKGNIKVVDLAYCKNIELEGASLVYVDQDETAEATLVSKRNSDLTNIDLTASNLKINHNGYDNTTGAGRIYNYQAGRYTDERDINNPLVMRGKVSNWLKQTQDPGNTGTWAVSNTTKTRKSRVGPNGVQDYETWDLTATASGGTVTTTADTTWDGWKVVTVWLKRVVGTDPMIIRVKLNNSGGEVVSGYSQITDEWKPYSVTGYDISGDPLSLEIQMANSSDQVAIHCPSGIDGKIPGPSIINSGNVAIPETPGTTFTGGAYFGYEKVGKVYHSTENVNPGSIANGAQVLVTNTGAGYADLGDYVSVSPLVDIGGLHLSAHVSSLGVVNIYIINNSGGAIDPNGGAAFDINIRVWSN